MGDPRTRDPESAADVQRLRRRVRELERALDQREQELATLLASKSFRLTAPLRWMRRMLTGRQLPVPALPARAEAPSVSGIPRRLRAQIGEVGANSSHRLLDLDKPLKQLLSAPVHSGRLARLSPGTECYLGSAPDALRVAALASRELREELSFDARITPLQREHWQDSLRREAYDFLLIESAWEPEGAGELRLQAPLPPGATSSHSCSTAVRSSCQLCCGRVRMLRGWSVSPGWQRQWTACTPLIPMV